MLSVLTMLELTRSAAAYPKSVPDTAIGVGGASCSELFALIMMLPPLLVLMFMLLML